MDKAYADTVRLLLAAAPEVFANDIFAMKGGSAINLFVRDMPRLSVDIDVVYRQWQTPREDALADIAGEIDAIAGRLANRGMRTRRVAAAELDDVKLGLTQTMAFHGQPLPSAAWFAVRAASGKPRDHSRSFRVTAPPQPGP